MWKSLNTTAIELRSSLVLFSGQSFRWVRLVRPSIAVNRLFVTLDSHPVVSLDLSVREYTF